MSMVEAGIEASTMIIVQVWLGSTMELWSFQDFQDTVQTSTVTELWNSGGDSSMMILRIAIGIAQLVFSTAKCYTILKQNSVQGTVDYKSTR